MPDSATPTSDPTLPPTTATILVADDSDADIDLLRIAFNRAKVPVQIATAHDGQEAVDYLAGAIQPNGMRRHPLPALLVLDLNMPRMNGFDVLTWMNRRPQLQKLPVVVMTCSGLEEDRVRARNLGADDYIVKPDTLPDLVRMAASLRERWLGPRNDEN